MREAIVNTSPLQYLHQLEQLQLLPQLYDVVHTTPAVIRELSTGLAQGTDVPRTAELPWLTVSPPGSRILLPVAAGLGAGEAEVLALALDLHAPVLVLDDLRARRCAKLLGIKVTGTLGVLLKAKEQGHIELIAPLLDRLDQTNFFLDPATRKLVQRLAGEE